MAWSAKEIRKKKYLPFPGHNDNVSKLYHSEKLPNPNVIRIEVLSPSAKAAYLNGGLYAMTNRFQQALMESMLYDDATKPFYGFFDPEETAGVTFGVTASWERGKHGFGEVAGVLKDVTGAVSGIPVVGGVGKVAGKIIGAAEKIGEYSKKLANTAGLNTESTGACTMRDFKSATFDFSKTVKCKWYMPEQEYMARLSISRLLTLTFLRSANMDDKDVLGKLTSAISELTSSQEWENTMSSISSIGSEIVGIGKSIGKLGKSYATDVLGGGIVNGATDLMNGAGEMIGDISNAVSGTWGLNEKAEAAKNALAPSEDTKSLAGDVMKQIVNGGTDILMKVNSFFGGNITVNPFPVRVTIGHILDIEPVVIEKVTFHASKEQFISEDGTHIPLYSTADIQFGMWMTPDPKKGFIRWMGDDVFNGGSYPSSAKAGKNSGGKNSGTSGSTGGNKKKGGSKKTK